MTMNLTMVDLNVAFPHSIPLDFDLVMYSLPSRELRDMLYLANTKATVASLTFP